MIFSVLEQFEITKFALLNPFLFVFFLLKKKEQKLVSFFNKMLLMINRSCLLIRFKYGSFKRIIVKIFIVIQSFFFSE